MGAEKQRLSRHNGRSGKNGVYNSKHNDREFNLEHADNIDKDRTNQNRYWDYQNGLRTHEENQAGGYPTFEEIERRFYAERYAGYVTGQNARNVKGGHANRNRSTDDLLKNRKTCPEETIYQNRKGWWEYIPGGAAGGDGGIPFTVYLCCNGDHGR